MRHAIRKSLATVCVVAAVIAGGVFVTGGFDPPVAEAVGPQFDTAAFTAAQAAGKTVLVDVWAPWCPTCRAQAPVIESLLGEPAFAGVVKMRVHYDNQKDAVRRFEALSQSTLIVFKGFEERARATGVVDRAEISAMISKGL